MTDTAATTDLRTRLAALADGIEVRLAAVADLAALDALEAESVGRSSELAAARRGLGKAPAEDRAELGRLINEVAQAVGAKIAARRRDLEYAAEAHALAADRIDVTLPGRVPPRGTHHLITSTMEDLVDIFVSLGYTVATGPEVETAWHNFTALNIPPSHPSRAESDTLYVDYGPDPEEIVLRTHTSPMQARYMLANDPPVYLVVPGRVFRRDAIDATHSPVFHQMEGLAVDTDITFADLKGTLRYFAQQFFGADRTVRFLPNHFPFTEPSAEMHVSCFACDGSGCRVCGNTGWIEIIGCGMVNPAVFEHVGYDPAAVTGFAFGMGVDRIAQVRHGISDVRHLFESDLRVLRQFR